MLNIEKISYGLHLALLLTESNALAVKWNMRVVLCIAKFIVYWQAKKKYGTRMGYLPSLYTGLLHAVSVLIFSGADKLKALAWLT